MTEFRLSPERRNALSGLLGDEQEFRAAYPAVADYLDTAARLPGSGDAAGEQAFDLRLLHFMTGGESADPYWDIVAPAVGARSDGRRVVGVGGGSARLAFAQTVLQAAYSYAVPAPETVAWIADGCAGRRVLEIGAGRGYWAHQLAERGVEVIAFDREPPDGRQNIWFPEGAGQRTTWHRVGDLDELGDLSPEHWAASVLFLCWPPGWDNPMASQSLAAYRRAGGDRVIYVGEPRGGKTGDAAFFAALAAEWEVVEEDSKFVSWWNLNDSAWCYRWAG
ncbi:class I SAM-dependent methyltransferase [Nocardia uniformis]|uniref:Class I SAM-dependent methyltransferase n=1 Tax=Nocardia uniformis TaxID=53432 RepID=A0A849C250_9NOCA|nr:class I SAM-dependent methyltransferase [Nocardia uniformis]NNH69079.1 class I SAM-dependent methyltransferase [Nocardia uniformis]